MTQPLRIIFAGTPEFASLHLQAVIDSPHEVIAVYSQPDRPAGRGRKLTPSPVKQLALEHNIPVFQPKTLKTEEAQQELAALKPDLMVVVAYGLLLPQAVLDIPNYGCINVHGSILPAGGGLRRFSAPSPPATVRVVSPSCRWMPVWIPVICC